MMIFAFDHCCKLPHFNYSKFTTNHFPNKIHRILHKISTSLCNKIRTLNRAIETNELSLLARLLKNLLAPSVKVNDVLYKFSLEKTLILLTTLKG